MCYWISGGLERRWFKLSTMRISIHTTASVVTPERRLERIRRNISIHTTASVVTNSDPLFTVMLLFQSTPLHQWWLPYDITFQFMKEFQSTPLHQWWQFVLRKSKQELYFNPHHCISGDGISNNQRPADTISIHTTASVVTTRESTKLDNTWFQSTPLHQWWHGSNIINDWYQGFQSTPLHQWWQQSPSSMSISRYFNPHHCISGDCSP